MLDPLNLDSTGAGTYQNPVKYFCVMRSTQSSSGLSIKGHWNYGHLTMEDASRSETNHSKEIVPQNPGKHFGQGRRNGKGSQGKPDLGNKVELHEKLK